MSVATKTALLCCVVFVGVMLISRANRSLEPALPNDMPADARFVPTGYDLEHNERQGNWVACHPDGGVAESFCRVADAHGTVIFQGNFLPVRDRQQKTGSTAGGRVEISELKWVQGPIEGIPVPAIPMSDGSLLIPRDDRDALLDRWKTSPEEWKQLQSR